MSMITKIWSLLIFAPILVFAYFGALAGCSMVPGYNIVDEVFISKNEQIFEGLQRGATFGRSDSEDYVNLYVRRTGSSLWIQPLLYFSTGETIILAPNTFVQIALPRKYLTENHPYRIISRTRNSLHETLIWIKDNVNIANLVIDHRVNESTLFLLGMGLGGLGEIDIASWLVLPYENETKDVSLVSKRLNDCRGDQCTQRIKDLLANNMSF